MSETTPGCVLALDCPTALASLLDCGQRVTGLQQEALKAREVAPVHEGPSKDPPHGRFALCDVRQPGAVEVIQVVDKTSSTSGKVTKSEAKARKE